MTLEASVPRPVLLIGVGNRYRSDDGIGVYVADLLGRRRLAGVEVLECSGEGVALIEAWSRRVAVLLFDAVRGGPSPGTIHRIDALQQELPQGWGAASTHAFGVVEALQLSRALGQLPGKLMVYGIEGQEFGPGTQLSGAVEAAGRRLVDEVVANLSAAC